MPAPSVTSISPSIGSILGGGVATIRGTDFTGTTGVTIGGTAATNVVVVNSTTVTCTLPAHVLGVASVLVTNGSGTNGANSLFIYIPNDPANTYVYLKGGRGDGYVPLWTGALSEEGAFDNDTGVLSDEGREVGEPYRDIFQTGGQPYSIRDTLDNGAGGEDFADFNAEKELSLPSGAAYYPVTDGADPALAKETWRIINEVGAITPGAAVVAQAFDTSISDDLKHQKPRLFTKVCTWLVFTSSNGLSYKFRKADVIGWGSQRRDE